MNTERLYENAKEALRLACISVHGGNEPDGNGLYNRMVKDPEIYLRASDKYLWHDALPALEIYIAAKDELGKTKHGSAYTAMKRIIAAVPDARKNIKGVWNDAEGRQCACDGYRAVRLKKPVEGFESVPGMDLNPVFPKDYMLKEELHVPTPGELKINKKKLASGATVYDFGEGFPMVMAAYLKDIIDILPDAKAYATGGESSPIVFQSERGDALLLGVRKRSA